MISAPALAPTESKMATKRELTPVVVAELLVLALAPTESKMATKRELTPAVDVISAPALVPTESKMEMRLALIPAADVMKYPLPPIPQRLRALRQIRGMR